ncbi:hypothetical protein B0I37DRAFT_235757 [Chaetomium sp. MPI-CAGE-AT-0009]|nr:hypothetical protein B0I37DRAFT_235757 [Chaetomium sp. MPI-CAGE-AT-0009]
MGCISMFLARKWRVVRCVDRAVIKPVWVEPSCFLLAMVVSAPTRSFGVCACDKMQCLNPHFGTLLLCPTSNHSGCFSSPWYY